MSSDAIPPSDFRHVLQELVVSVPGAWGAIFVDFEGEAVDLYATSDAYEVKLAGAHAGLLWGRIVAAGNEAKLGKSRGVAVLAQGQRFFVHALDAEYFVLLATAAKGPAGLARARLALAVTALRKLL